MVLSVCVGSSCHLKGSYDVIEAFKRLIEKHGLGDKVELRACFCLGRVQTALLSRRTIATY